MDSSQPHGIFSAAAEFGLRTFPVLAGNKIPSLKWTEYKDRSPTAAEIAVWDVSDFNVGIICGTPSDIVVVDTDNVEAEAFLLSLELPRTPMVKTAKGYHRYFRKPAVTLKNKVRLAGHAIDIRADGGYVVGAGSTHQTGVIYEWEITPRDVAFAEFPKAILDLFAAEGAAAPLPTATEGIEVPTEHGIGRFLSLVLREACSEIAGCTEGSRNQTLFKSAVGLARHVAAANAEWSESADALRLAALAVGLEEAETQATLASAWSAGWQEPTQWVAIAGDWIYLGAQERFYHKPSGAHLKPGGFNGKFGRPHGGADTFSGFLLNWGYITKMQDITYEPAAPPGAIGRDGLKFYNTFRPSDVIATPGDPAPFVEFMEYLVPTDFERQHLLKVMAFTVRNPGVKVRHAMLLGSTVQGVGKSLVAEIWGQLLGSHNVRKTSSGEISGAFQGWIKENLLVVCEELNIGQGLAVYNDLKDLITSDKRPINEKHLAVREWPIYSTFLMLTNLKVPLLIEATDRRLFVIDSPAQKRDKSYYAGLFAWLSGNIGVVRWYLDQVNLADFGPHDPPPMTEAKRALIKGSRHPILQEVEYLIQERTGPLDRDVVTLDDVIVAFDHRNRPTPHKLGKALRELGAENMEQHWVDGRRVTLWVVRNVNYWTRAGSNDRVEEFKRRFGMFAGWPVEIPILHMSEWPVDKGQAY